MKVKQLIKDRILEIEGEVHRLKMQIDRLAKEGSYGKFADINRHERIMYQIKLYNDLYILNNHLLSVLNGKS